LLNLMLNENIAVKGTKEKQQPLSRCWPSKHEPRFHFLSARPRCASPECDFIESHTQRLKAINTPVTTSSPWTLKTLTRPWGVDKGDGIIWMRDRCIEGGTSRLSGCRRCFLTPPSMSHKRR
jgi:hypothetical protein